MERNSANMFLAPEERNVYRTESRLDVPRSKGAKFAPFFRS